MYDMYIFKANINSRIEGTCLFKTSCMEVSSYKWDNYIIVEIKTMIFRMDNADSSHTQNYENMRDCKCMQVL